MQRVSLLSHPYLLLLSLILFPLYEKSTGAATPSHFIKPIIQICPFHFLLGQGR